MVFALTWVIVGIGALLLSVRYHVDLPLARRAAPAVVSNLVSGEIMGTLRIGRVDALGAGEIVTRHVELLDPQGRRVAVADRVTLVPDLGAALLGTLRFDSAVLETGTVRLVTGESGQPTFIETFAPRRPGRSANPLHAIVDGIRVQDLTVYGELLGRDGLRVEDLRATGRIEARGALEVKVFSATGRVVRPYPFVGHLEHVYARIHSDPTQGIRLAARGHVAREGGPTDQARLSLSYAVPEGGLPGDPLVLDLRVAGAPLDASFLGEVGYGWAALFEGPLQGRFRLQGIPAESLELRASATSAGGPVRVRATLPAEGEAQVALSSEGLDLQRVVRGAPALRVAGRARLHIDGTDEGAPPRVRIEAQPTVYDRFAIPSFELEGAILEDALRIDHVRAPYAAGQVSGEGRVGFDGAIDVRVRGRIPEISRDPNIRRVLPDAHGSLAGDVRLRTNVREERSELSLAGRLSLGDLRYGPLVAPSLTIRGSVSGRASSPVVSLQMEGHGVAIAHYPLGKADLTVRGGPRAYAVSGTFMSPEGRRIAIVASVRKDGPIYRVETEQLELGIGNDVWRGALSGLAIDPDRSVTIGRLLLAAESQRLEGGGVIRFRGPEDIEASLQDFDLEGLAAILGPAMPDVRGRADATVSFQGDLRRPDLLIQGALRDGSLLGLGDVNAVYAVEYRDGALLVDGSVDLGDRGSLAIGGTGALDPTIPDPLEALSAGAYELELTVTDLTLEVPRDLSRGAMPPVEGRIDGAVRLSGFLVAPELSGELRVPALDLPGWPTLDASTAFVYQGGALVVRVTTVDEHGELAEAEGSLVLDVVNLVHNPDEVVAALELLPWRLSLRVPPRPLGDLPEPARALVPELLWPLSVGVSGTFSGGALDTRGHVHVSTAWEGPLDVFCRERGQPRMSVDAELQDGVTTAVVRGFLGTRRVLDAELVAPTPLDAWLARAQVPDVPPLRLTAFADNVPLESLPVLCRLASGPVTAAVELAGLFTDEPRGQAELHSSSLRVLGTQPVRADATVTIEDGVLEAEVLSGWWSGERAVFTGRLPVEWDASHVVPALRDDDVFLTADLERTPVAPLVAWIPQVVDVAGYATGRVEARGRLSELQTTGTLTLSEGYLEIVGLGQHLTDVGGELEFHGNWARVRRLRAYDGDGFIDLDGSVGFDGFLPSRARLGMNATRFPVRQEGTPLATLTGNASIVARLEEDGADLEIDVRRLSVHLPEEGTRSIQDLAPHPDVVILGDEPPETDPDAAYPIRIRVDARRPFWVSRPDFSVRVISQLDVEYRSPELRVAGFIELQRGFFDVFGKRFDVERGAMNFDGGLELDPEVNLVARHALRSPPNTSVTVYVTGTLSEPEVEFRSDHPTCNERSDIIAMLVSGRCGAVSRSETGDDRASEQAAVAFLGGVLAGVGTIWARGELGQVVRSISIESDEIRAGFQADSIIPGFLRPIVQGAYLEGRLTQDETGEGQVDLQPGVLLELQFPWNLVGTSKFEPPSNWSVDLTWEP